MRERVGEGGQERKKRERGERVNEREIGEGERERGRGREYTTHQSWLKSLTDSELVQAVCLL